jgi:Protein of unknown function (DUF1360)
MTEFSVWMRFLLAVLATWRIAHLLASEDGPWDLVVRLRVRLGGNFAGRLMDCFYCLSVWVAAPLAFFVCRRPLDLAVTWLALSGAACLLERIGQQPISIQPMTASEETERRAGENNDVLWPRPGNTGAGDHADGAADEQSYTGSSASDRVDRQ